MRHQEDELNSQGITQEEFDVKREAEYETYGLHIRKVYIIFVVYIANQTEIYPEIRVCNSQLCSNFKIVRNRLAPYRDASGHFSSRKLAVKTMLGLFPFIDIMRHYKLKTDLLKDFLAGLTVFVMGIPQAMAYGMLSGLGAVHGLYTCTFPTLLYFFFGTSRHLAFGNHSNAVQILITWM